MAEPAFVSRQITINGRFHSWCNLELLSSGRQALASKIAALIDPQRAADAISCHRNTRGQPELESRLIDRLLEEYAYEQKLALMERLMAEGGLVSPSTQPDSPESGGAPQS